MRNSGETPPNLWPFPLWDFPCGIKALRCGTHEPLISIPSRFPVPWALAAFNCSHPLWWGLQQELSWGQLLQLDHIWERASGSSGDCRFQRQVGGGESKSNFLVCLDAWGSQTVWSYGKNSQVFQLRGSIKLANHLGNYVIFHRPTSIKTKGGRHVKKEWPWSHTSAERLGNSIWTGVWKLSDEVPIVKVDTNRHAELQEHTSVSMVNYPCRFYCCMQIIKIKLETVVESNWKHLPKCCTLISDTLVLYLSFFMNDIWGRKWLMYIK